jgi:hypothetical protein
MHSPRLFSFRYMRPGLVGILAVIVACSSSSHHSLTNGAPGTVVSAQTLAIPPLPTTYPGYFRPHAYRRFCQTNRGP